MTATLTADPASAGARTSGSPFHVMTKPVGPICNLDCRYCFYLEKETLYPTDEKWRMGQTVLESYIRQYIEAQDAPEITFAWQGGEPTLLGVEFFQRIVEYQTKYAAGKKIDNALQTNGTLLDDAWCEFLTRHRFLVGLSIDGPRELHDTYRVDKQGRGTFDDVMRGIGFLKKHRTDFNTLTVVNRANAARPMEVYRFLKEVGVGFMQFIPLVERAGAAAGQAGVALTVKGLTFAPPPTVNARGNHSATEWSVGSEQWGDFMIAIFEQWVRSDVGKVFVQMFDVALGAWMGMGGGLCVFAETCGRGLAMEHNGDVYSCDHYVYPEYKLGNLNGKPLRQLVDSDFQRKFGNDKRDTLPGYCRRCPVKFACNGDCPKHRFVRTPDGEEGLSYLCAGYRKFFLHVDPYMKVMGELVRRGQPAAMVTEMMALSPISRPGKPTVPMRPRRR